MLMLSDRKVKLRHEDYCYPLTHSSCSRPMQTVASVQPQPPPWRRVDHPASRVSQSRMWQVVRLTLPQPSSGGPTGIPDETGVKREGLEELCASEVSLSGCWCDLIISTDLPLSCVINHMLLYQYHHRIHQSWSLFINLYAVFDM